MAGEEIRMVPTRVSISAQHATEVGSVIAERMMAQWGLSNASVIVGEMEATLRRELERRKRLDEGKDGRH